MVVSMRASISISVAVAMQLVKSTAHFITSVIPTSYPVGSRVVPIGSILVALYLVYEKVLRPPPSLRHIPHLNFFTLFKALAMGKTIDQLIKETNCSDVVQSSPNGLYLRRDNLGWSVRVTRPEDVKLVMSQRELFPKSVGSRKNRRGTLAGRALIGPNVLYASGDEWKRHRRVLSPAFRRDMPMKEFASISQKAIDVIDTDKPTDMFDLSHRWALDTMGKTILDYSFDTLDHEDSEWIIRLRRIAKVVQDPVYFIVPFIERNFKFLIPELNAAHQEMTVYADMINDIVRQRRDAVIQGKLKHLEEREKDLLTLMIEASIQGKENFSDEEFQANIIGSFLVGHDTTSSSMTFTLYHLAAHPDIQQRAREEAIRVFGDGDDIHPTFQETRELPYITMVIKEALRINPPITTLTDRIATDDTEIAGTFIPKGTHVGLTIYELHHNPKIWKDPDTFNPERFAPGGEAEQVGGIPWIPFGNGGARVCIGMKSSMTQQRVFLSMLLRKYEWRLPEGSIHKNGMVTNGYVLMRPESLGLAFKKRY